MTDKQTEGVQNLITEDELLELFGISKNVLGNLRRTEQLPFLKVTRYKRLYLESSVVEWLMLRETVLNVGSGDGWTTTETY
ncbi:MAG: helix-turn-helix domain-containing protein [Planctomycetes bacterium]|nr:helix-turn-helix domain-containing protein [Planctomycetota bacterium]